MLPMFRSGISALAFSAAIDAGSVDYSKVRTHADLDEALGDRPLPDGWVGFKVGEKQDWLTKNPVPAVNSAPAGDAPNTAPEVAAGEGTTTIVEATSAATTEENPASTTRADDPERDSTFSGTTTAETLENVTQEPNSNDLGAAAGDGAAPPAPEPNREQATGNRHSHPAQTTAEATSAAGGHENTLSGEIVDDVVVVTGGDMPAGEAADPAVAAPEPTTDAEGGALAPASIHDESGVLQDATRQAIGAGAGAPDGVGADGADPSELEANQANDQLSGANDDASPVALGNGNVIEGGNAKLWRRLEAGATHAQLVADTGYKSVIGTIYSLANSAGRSIETSEVDGERFYKLVALEGAAE